MSPVVQIMEHLVSRCQETCQLAILDQGQVFYVEKVDSNQTIRTITRVGDRRPANATALGKALLSGLTDQEVRELYAEGLPHLTEQTITDMETLLAQLSEIRAGGFALEQGESTPQLACSALPLRQRDRVFAAMSVAVPLFRATEEKQALIRSCLLEAREAIELLAERRDFILT
ncbi:transcriptional regulator, IclR family [gut metagenome]|uniref:Transcriptional regulator, IclR family n=1 Tax=gut metagenome TaxID=749906 RepID=J9G4C9_9ZZZZ